VALAVVDRHQRSGIGHGLLRVLRETAARHGVRRFVFSVHPRNGGALAMLRTLGAATRFADGVVEGHITIGEPLAG
jgi:ribosomal protein S18 acetylase RimI-like enzyme